MMATLNQLFGKMPTIPGIAELLKPTANAPRTKLAVLADSFLSDRNTADKEWEFFKAASIGKSPRSPGVAQQETDTVTYRNVTGRHPKKKMRRAALAVK
jgi:hypothetical protein